MRILLLLGALCALGRAGEDPFERYLREAPEFVPVATVLGRWETWYFMPWRYRWTIGTGNPGGRFCRRYGINGGFTDHGAGPLAWLEKWNLRFYNDHTAGKGILFLRGANDKSNFRAYQRDPRAVRLEPLDDKTLEKARALVRRSLREVHKSPMRLAYALDDEISWGAFVIPLPWRVHGDDEDYGRWLERYHGEPREPRYVTPDFTRRQLDRPLAELDFSPLLDRLTYNDSVFANFVGKLVETANEVDPETPCGFVGGQGPSAWGGYDYAKLCKKAQFLEVYDVGSAPEIVRSLAPDVPLVSTHFHGEASDRWLAWSRFAHGQRGMIGWVDGWFDGTTPRPWLREFAPALRELGGKLGPRLVGARWVHDGIAIYYSHPSIQVSWCLDSEPHGSTWPNRGNDHRLGTSHLVRKAWEHLLNDADLQYDFLAYDTVARSGVPEEYRVLVLPACFALSDVEAQRIEEFVKRGGTVVADFMCGLFDEHGRGRRKGALDELFGVAHDGTETRRDFFGRRLWVETDQEKGYSAKRFKELFRTTTGKERDGYRVAELRLKGPYVRGSAYYLNLSPQRYLEYRQEGEAKAMLRRPFVEALGVEPRVRAAGAPDLEVTTWTKRHRLFVFAFANPGGRGKVGIELAFREHQHTVVDERTGRRLGDGSSFMLELDLEEAVLVSCGP